MPKAFSKPIKAPAKKNNLKNTSASPIQVTEKTRSYMSQVDIPAFSLDEALAVAKAIFENYGGHGSTPLDVAVALNMQTSNPKFRMLCGASIAYGLTVGGYNAQAISPTQLAKRIFEPLEDGEDLKAKREAVLKPRIIREFLSKYSGSPLPREEIGHNVLKSLKVPSDRAKAVWDLILSTAEKVGFIRVIKDKKYADLAGVKPVILDPAIENHEQINDYRPEIEQFEDDDKYLALSSSSVNSPQVNPDGKARKVFITHGKNTTFIDPIKKLLGFGEMIPVVSVEKQSVAQPVPDKVMSDMRACGAAIIHVEGELVLID